MQPMGRAMIPDGDHRVRQGAFSVQLGRRNAQRSKFLANDDDL
jgi:hypothetical protein